MKRTTSRCGPLFAVATVLASAWLLTAADPARAAGDLVTAGKNASGQLGIGTAADSLLFTNGSHLSDLVTGACGYNHTLAVMRGGTLVTCGLNDDGQLGLGHNTSTDTFSIVQTPPTPVVAAAGGLGHSIIATNDGACYTTGKNDQGQLGLGDLTARNVFTQVTGLSAIVAVAAGERHSLALDAFGNVYASGDGSSGQLGVGYPDYLTTFVPVFIPYPVIAIACGANHSMAIDIFLELWVWGASESGQLGIGISGPNAAVGSPVFAGGGVIMIAGGGQHSIVETSGGIIYTAGRNIEGQLGLGDNNQRDVFTAVNPAVVCEADAIGAGKDHSLVVSASNSATPLDTYIYVTGMNANGQLGLGNTTNHNGFVANWGAGTGYGLVCGGEGHSLAVSNLVSTIQFLLGTVAVNESVGTVSIVVSLSPASRKTCTVDYAVTGGTATQGVGKDYTFTNGTLTFQPGQTKKTISVTVLNDALSEDNETAQISLSNPVNIGLGDPNIFVLTILDNDPLPTISFAAAASSSPENVLNPVIQVQLDAPAGRTIRVTCKATGGTAVPGIDFKMDSTTIQIPAGATTANVPITVFDNTVPNPDKTVVLTLSAPVNATLGAQTAHTLTIADDEPPTIQFASAASSVSEAALTQNVKVTLSRAYDKVVTVKYAASGGTATGGVVDYTLAAGTLTFGIGVTSQNITVGITDDGKAEPDETVKIGLSTPTNGSIGTPSTHTLTLLDTSPAVLSVQSSGGIDFGNVGFGVQKIIQNAYTISNLGGGTLHAQVSCSDPPFQAIDKNGVPAFVAQFDVSSGTPKKIALSCVPYVLGSVSRTITFSGDGTSVSTTRNAKCVGVVQTSITTVPTSVLKNTTVNLAWTVEGGTPTHNDIHWATTLAALAASPNKTAQDLVAPYTSWFRAPATAGTVYIQSHAIISGKAYLSPAKTITVK